MRPVLTVNRRSMTLALAALALVSIGFVARSAVGASSSTESAQLRQAKAEFAKVDRALERRAAMEPAIQARLDYLNADPSTSSSRRATARAGVIRACMKSGTGELRIANTCKRGETQITWNTAGPAGPAGPAGSAAAKTIVYEDVFGPYYVPDTSFGGSADRKYTCSRGGTAINAGYLADELGVLIVNTKQDATYGDTWFMQLQNLSGADASVYVTLYCAL